MTQIEAVTFDLWDTLIQEVPGGAGVVAELRLDAIQRILDGSGFNPTRETLEAAYRRTGDRLEAIWSREEDISVGEQVHFLLDSLDPGLLKRIGSSTLADVEKAYSESMLQHRPKLLTGAKATLVAVKESGRKMGLISNTGKTPGSVLRAMLGDMDILDRFDVAVFSNEVRARKPARKIFDVALAELDVKPGRAVHVGDNPWADIDGAKVAGMSAIQVGLETARGRYVADAYVPRIEQVTPALESLASR
ncbi:MAG: HAD family hydrolase [Methanobacteriota archaeon]|nr:MAG: HAD family hydrolase [Euryarchaeota archaeon]